MTDLMIWLELSRDPDHGGEGWEFGRSLWSPARKWSGPGETASRSAFWETVLHVKKGDRVLHLRGIPPNAAFVGVSTAATDGLRTVARPPTPREWGYADSFYRVELDDYRPLKRLINLNEVFAAKKTVLGLYFALNRARPPNLKRRLFYEVKRTGRPQCQNGAYLTHVDDDLEYIILGSNSLSGRKSLR